MSDRPEFTHQRERHGLIGPFSGKQILAGFLVIVVAVVVLVGVTTPLGNTAGTTLIDPRATPFVIASPTEGLHPGDLAPEFTLAQADGTTYQLADLDGQPIRLADLRGKVVWVNFWTTWCPPCQYEVPILRELSERYKDQGLEVIGVSVQETTPADVAAYAAKYDLQYTIGFDGYGYVSKAYKVFALPTQFFIDVNGIIRQVANGPVDEDAAAALIESMLPPAGSPGTSALPSQAGPAPSASPSGAPSPS